MVMLFVVKNGNTGNGNVAGIQEIRFLEPITSATVHNVVGNREW